MSNIISITLYKIEDRWEIGVVRDDDYNERRKTDLADEQDLINRIVTLAETVKTQDQLKVEELEKEKEEMLIMIDSQLTDEQRLEMIDIFPTWEVGMTLEQGNKVKYEGRLYEVIQAHKTQADWVPDFTKALFKEILPPNAIGEFVQPTGQHDAYSYNDKVIFEGWVWVSIIDNNVWSPKDYPQGWEKEREV